MTIAEPSRDFRRGRHDFSMTVLKLGRLMDGGLVAIAGVCGVMPEILPRWVYGMEVPSLDAWASLLAIADHESVKFSRFAQAYVRDSQVAA